MTSPKANGSGIPKWLYAIFGVGVFISGAIVGVVADIKTNPQGSIDAWTGTQHRQYAALVDEKLDTLTKATLSLTESVNRHAQLDMHHGSRVQFAEIKGVLKQLEAGQIRQEKWQERIEKRIEKIDRE